MGLAVDQAFVNFVGDEYEAAMQSQFGEALEKATGKDRAGRVAWAVEDHGARSRGDRRLNSLEVGKEPAGRLGRDGNHHPARQLDLLGVGHPIRGRDDDFVAWADHAHQCVEHAVLRSARDHDLFRFGRNIVLSLELLDDGLLEFGDAARGSIFGFSFAEGSDRRLDHGLGRTKIGLAGGEIQDVDSFSSELARTSGDRKRRRRAEPPRASRKSISGHRIDFTLAREAPRGDPDERAGEGQNGFMIRLPWPVVLASASPRRQALLARLIPEFEVFPADLDETPKPEESPWRTAQRLARDKALSVFDHRRECLVLAGDTVVAMQTGRDWHQLGKPRDAEEASEFLRRLSGQSHTVITGVCFRWPEGSSAFTEASQVRFRVLSEEQIAEYVASGEPLDKAGGYGLQGVAANFIERIEGSADNVIGLPLDRLEDALRSAF